MLPAVEQILKKIEENEKKIRVSEGEAVNLIMEQGRLLRQLKRKVHKNWLQAVEDIGLNERVARRYLKIGEEWATPDRTPGSDLLARLPYDLHKLEWLCRLPVAELEQLCDANDPRQVDRAGVIKEVQRRLGEEVQAGKRPTLKALRTSWQNSFEALLTKVGELDQEDRRRCIAELENRLDELKEELREVGEEQPDQEGPGEAEADGSREE